MMPDTVESYIHIAGRTGRVGRRGTVVSVLTEREWARAGVITRALGMQNSVAVDMVSDSPQLGDVYVLCSDGLDREVDDAEIAIAIEAHSSGSLSDTLVELALSRGSRDNVTVVSVHIDHTLSEQANDEEDTVPGAAGM